MIPGTTAQLLSAPRSYVQQCAARRILLLTTTAGCRWQPSPGRQVERGQRVEEAGGQAAQAAVAQRRVALLLHLRKVGSHAEPSASMLAQHTLTQQP